MGSVCLRPQRNSLATGGIGLFITEDIIASIIAGTAGQKVWTVVMEQVSIIRERETRASNITLRAFELLAREEKPAAVAQGIRYIVTRNAIIALREIPPNPILADCIFFNGSVG
jgi:hypothetical protein